MLTKSESPAPTGEEGAQFVDAAGIPVHVRQWGAGADILLIHGASSDHGVFEPTVVPLLQERFRLTAFDRPGLGFTAARPAGAETLAVQAKVAAGVSQALSLKRPLVVGHSWGGAVALRLALDRPDLIGGLVLIAPVAYQWPGGVTWHLYWSSNPIIGGVFNHVITRPFTEIAARNGLRGAFWPSPVPEHYVAKASVMRAARPPAMKANSLDMMAAKREIIGQQGRYAEIDAPVAIMAGAGDTVVSTAIHSLPLAQKLANARIDILRDAGHLPHEAAPDRLLKLVDWTQSVARAS